MKKSNPTTNSSKKYFETAIGATKNFFKTDFGIALLVVVAWQFIMTIFGYVIDITTTDAFHNPAMGGSLGGLLGHTFRWDSGWYQQVINTFYVGGSPAAPAFYPLYPLLVQGTHVLSFGLISVLASSLILNTIATWLAITAFVKIVKIFTKKSDTPWLIVALFLCSPAALFLHMFYGEAIFIALGFWAYLFALKGNWKYVAILLCFALLARLPAVTFILLCGLEYLRSYKWNIKKALLNKNILWFLIVPIGLLGYATYLYFVRGDFLAMSNAYSATNDWAYYHFTPNILDTLYNSAATIHASYFSGNFDPRILVDYALPLAGLAILIAASIYAIFGMKNKGIPLGIFGIVSFIMFTINGHMVSAHRYLLPCIVIFIVAAVLIEKYKTARYLLYPVLYTSVLIQTILIVLFINVYFAG